MEWVGRKGVEASCSPGWGATAGAAGCALKPSYTKVALFSFTNMQGDASYVQKYFMRKTQ